MNNQMQNWLLYAIAIVFLAIAARVKSTIASLITQSTEMILAGFGAVGMSLAQQSGIRLRQMFANTKSTT